MFVSTFRIAVIVAFGQIAWTWGYVIRTMDDVKNANKHTNITIADLHVPAGVPFKLLGLKDATITFTGITTFGYAEWVGHMMVMSGENVTVTGDENHIIYCGGERWWDGLGANGGKRKPKFWEVRLVNSEIRDLRIKNTPMHAVSINHSQNLTVSDVFVDNWDGDVQKGHNTDGFNVYESRNVTIRRCVVKNQDDCIAVKSGTDLTFRDNSCSGGHGLSIGSVGGRNISNIVERVKIFNNTVANSINGVRVKTVRNATGRVDDVTFENNTLSNISQYGVTVFGNYDLKHGGPVGEPTGGVPISNLRISNIIGNVRPNGINVWVYVANASNWNWHNIDISGGTKKRFCKGFPHGMTPLC